MQDTAPPQHRWSFSLRAMFTALTVFGVWLGVALSARDRSDGIAFAISSASLTWALWLAEPLLAARRDGWRLVVWSLVSMAFTAILCGLWPGAG